jgi:hypothetical protein
VVPPWRAIVAYVPCYVCFWVGHLVSRPMSWFDAAGWLYPVYNRLMGWSCDLNRWGGLDVWQPVKGDEG